MLFRSLDAQGRAGTTRNDATATIEKDETQIVHLRLEAYQWIRGIIRTPSGAPASGATVRMTADRGTRWTSTVVDVHGKFDLDVPGGTDEVHLIVLTYSYPAVALRAIPTSSGPLEINLPSLGGILRVDGGQNPNIQSMGVGIPLRFFYFPEPYGQYGGGVHLPAGTYVVCPDRDPRAQCKSATVAPSSETQIEFARPPQQRKHNEAIPPPPVLHRRAGPGWC